jgi:pentatricopeptide repeat protein
MVRAYTCAPHRGTCAHAARGLSPVRPYVRTDGLFLCLSASLSVWRQPTTTRIGRRQQWYCSKPCAPSPASASARYAPPDLGLRVYRCKCVSSSVWDAIEIVVYVHACVHRHYASAKEGGGEWPWTDGPERMQVCYNTCLRAHARLGQTDKAQALLETMRREHVAPDLATWVTQTHPSTYAAAHTQRERETDRQTDSDTPRARAQAEADGMSLSLWATVKMCCWMRPFRRPHLLLRRRRPHPPGVGPGLLSRPPSASVTACWHGASTTATLWPP